MGVQDSGHGPSSDVTAATEASVTRQAAWIAARDATYGLGDTTDKVVATIERLKAAVDTNPIVFSDSDLVLDGNFIVFLATAPEAFWEESAAVPAATRQQLATDVGASLREPHPVPVGRSAAGDHRRHGLHRRG